jgi:hypothetical protein
MIPATSPLAEIALCDEQPRAMIAVARGCLLRMAVLPEL